MDTPQEKEVHAEVTPSPVTEATVPTPEAPAIPVAGATPFYKKHQALIALVVGILVVLAGYFAYMALYGKGDVIATVNGKNIYANEFNESITLIEKNVVLQGVDISDETVKGQIRTQALETLINNTLIITAAKNAGIVVTDEAFKETYDALVNEVGGADTLTLRMAEIGLTEKELRENINERILADQYIESQTDIENLVVSEEEIQEFITALNAGEGELPPLEEIRPQIVGQILSQKQQQIVLDLLAKLRAEATIEINI